MWTIKTGFCKGDNVLTVATESAELTVEVAAKEVMLVVKCVVCDV